MNNDLKPCPFCGSQPKLERVSSNVCTWTAYLKLSCCHFSMKRESYGWNTEKRWHSTLKEAELHLKEAWNHRA